MLISQDDMYITFMSLGNVTKVLFVCNLPAISMIKTE